MLEELLPEGRRILLFSQFTSMLELLERELVAPHWLRKAYWRYARPRGARAQFRTARSRCF
jgi:SNF2 family DNA or RNA helicase